MGDIIDCGIPSAETLTRNRIEYILGVLFEQFPGPARELVKKFLFPEYSISDFAKDMFKEVSKEFLKSENYYQVCDEQGEIQRDIKQAFLSYLKEKNITNIPLLAETIRKQDESSGIQALATIFSHQYKSRPVYLMEYTERNHYMKILQKARDVLHDLQSKMLASPAEVKALSEVRATPLDLAFASRTMDYLINNKYKLLLSAAVVGYVVYDYYHENHVGKAAAGIKNSVLSFWQKEEKPTSLDEGKKQFTL